MLLPPATVVVTSTVDNKPAALWSTQHGESTPPSGCSCSTVFLALLKRSKANSIIALHVLQIVWQGYQHAYTTECDGPADVLNAA